MSDIVDPKIRALAEAYIAAGTNRRAILVLKALLDKGEITTDELSELGYGHPPRAAADVKDAGIPIVKTMTRSTKTGKRMAVYRFGAPDNIQEGRTGGRVQFSKKFRNNLLTHYGSMDGITGATFDSRVLQIDHRVPYRVVRDAEAAKHDVADYMLLNASSQRSKSWSCEHCPNIAARIEATCRTCFWAFPESYEHIATLQVRRTDIAWQGADVAVHDKLKAIAERQGNSVADLLRDLGRQKAKEA